MTVQDKLSIGAVIRNAIIFNPQNWRGGLVTTDTLIQDVDRLFELLHERKVHFVLVGGIALLQYVQGRNTQDIDLIMALAALKKVPEIVVTYQDQNFARGVFRGLQIDLLLTRNRLFDTVRRKHASVRPFLERDIPCATVDGLLLLKLYALPSLYRQGDMDRVGIYENDIATLIRHYSPAFDKLWAELGLHVSDSDLQTLKDIVHELQDREQRRRQGFLRGSP